MPAGSRTSARVDAIYYSDKNNLIEFKRAENVGMVDDCRRWVRTKAKDYNDASLTRGDYECGVDFMSDVGEGLYMYQETVK